MEIPDDIRKVAHSIAHVNFIRGPEQDDLTDAIADALMAERFRCAKIAEDYELVERILPLANISHNEAAMTGQNEAAERIAAAIRGDKPHGRD